MDGGTREKLLMKLMDFLSMLPEEGASGEGLPPEEGAGLGELLEGAESAEGEGPEAEPAVVQEKPKMQGFR